MSLATLPRTAALCAALLFATACTRSEAPLARYHKGDWQTARAAWQPQAEAGDGVAQYWLATLYHNGEGVARNTEESGRWYERAAATLAPLAEAGEREAQYLLGRMLRDGRGVEKNLAQAEHWWREAAEHGHAQAQHELGLAYFQGPERRSRDGFAQDVQAGAAWCARAHAALLPLAAEHDADAHHRIAQLYRAGCGVAKDSDEYHRGLLRAARRGDVQAQDTLGLYASLGLLGMGHRSDAFEWTRRAAEKGLARAQSRLGTLYELGRGVSKDQTEARQWYRRAAEQGNIAAQRKLAALENPVPGRRASSNQTIADLIDLPELPESANAAARIPRSRRSRQEDTAP